MDPTEFALVAALASRPDESTTRLVYADWLEENNRPHDAHAHRWMVAWKKWPTLRERTRPRMRIVKPYAWYIYRYSVVKEVDEAYEQDRQKPAWLPPLVFRALGHRALFGERMLYDTARAASAALVMAIKRGQHEFGLK